jgi:RNA recognition motif-containing protein
MGNKLYVGNLPFNTTEQSLNELFADHGAVTSARIITDRETGRSKGFGFVEMSNGDEAQSAIETLNGQEFQGRKLVVNEARPQEPRAPRGGGFGGGRR